MTEKGKPPANGSGDPAKPLSPVDAYLVDLGIETLEQLGEIPRKPGRATQHDEAVRAHFDHLIRIIDRLAEDGIGQEEELEARKTRGNNLTERIQRMQASIAQAAGATRLMWLLTTILRKYGGHPTIFCFEDDTTHPYVAGSGTGMTYSFNFDCGVSMEYRPWRSTNHMQVTLGGKGMEYFTVEHDGMLLPKEEGALIGFLRRHGIKAKFPPNPPACD